MKGRGAGGEGLSDMLFDGVVDLLLFLGCLFYR
jgi:hypothetical protein